MKWDTFSELELEKSMVFSWNMIKIHRKMRISKFCFDNAIGKWTMDSGIQCGEHPLTHRLGKWKKQVSNFSKNTENASKMDRKSTLAGKIIKISGRSLVIDQLPEIRFIQTDTFSISTSRDLSISAIVSGMFFGLTNKKNAKRRGQYLDFRDPGGWTA